VTVELFRIDDRLIHGQVVVGWGQPLDIGFIVLVDDTVAASDWEQELYRMGVPPEMEVYFHSAADAIAAMPKYVADPRRGILLTGDIATMQRLVDGGVVTTVNVGGITIATRANDFHQPTSISHSHGYSVACRRFQVSLNDPAGNMRRTC